MLKVFGHLNPDTDSVCSSIAYAWYLRVHAKQEAEAFILGTPNKEASYLLERFGQKQPERLDALKEGDEVVIVDTNNPEELPEEVKVASIREIVDHHKLVGGLSSIDPLAITMRPFGCVATVIWEKWKSEGITEVPEGIAGMLLGPILSDTLKFTSPTTTETDKQAAHELAKIAGVDIAELAEVMFAAKSDLSGMEASDLLMVDSKVFSFGDHKIRISTLETTKPENALAYKDELFSVIEAMKAADDLSGVFFFIVDILKSEAILLLPTEFEQKTAAKGFGKEVARDELLLPGVVSRKKQMVPALEKALS